MKIEEFNRIVDARTKKIKAVLVQKAKEYAQDNDRLHNFKVAARIKGSTQQQALWDFAVKHLVSIIDLIEGRLEPTEAIVNEKVGDMINYLILLEAVFAEERKK